MDRRISDWDRMVAGRLYNSSSKDIEKQHTAGMRRCDRFNRIPLWRARAKQRALERLIPSAKGKGFAAFAPFYCEYGGNIRVGEGCFLNYGCTFLDVAPITLGNGVWLGANVTLATPNHPFLAEERLPADYLDGRHDLEYAAPIVVEDGCWICSGVTVCRARSSVVNDGITNSSSSSREMSAVRSRRLDRNSTVCATALYILVFVPR